LQNTSLYIGLKQCILSLFLLVYTYYEEQCHTTCTYIVSAFINICPSVRPIYHVTCLSSNWMSSLFHSFVLHISQNWKFQ